MIDVRISHAHLPPILRPLGQRMHLFHVVYTPIVPLVSPKIAGQISWVA